MTTSLNSHLHDALSIHNLLTPDVDSSSADLTFARDELEYIPAIVNGYQQSLDFDTQTTTDKWCDWSRGYLSVPVSITPGGLGGAFSAAPVIAFKGSNLSLINGITIKTSGGQVLVEERYSTVFASHLRLLIEKHADWAVANTDSLHWAKDETSEAVLSGLTTGAALAYPKTAKFVAAPDGTHNNDNPVYNKGFALRNKYLLESAIQSDNTYPANSSAGFNTTLNLPLAAIHPFFEALDFPIINVRLQITFWLNVNSAGNPYGPMCMGTTQGGAVENGVGGYGIAVNPAVVQPRLYYHAVEFNAEQLASVNKRLSEGFTKRIIYTQHDINYLQQNVASTNQFMFQVSVNVVNPQRVWVMCFPSNVVNSSAWPSPITTGALGLIGVQLKINNRNYYNTQLDTWEQQYRLLKDAMPWGSDGGDASCRLTYGDFLKTYRLLCLDISRAENRQIDRNAPVSIQIQATPQSATAMDIIYLVERQMVCNMKFGAGAVMVEVGQSLQR
jgi:hypothetical protein